MNSCNSSNTINRVVMNLASACDAGWGLTFTDVFNNGYELFKTDFRVEKRCTSSFTEFLTAGEAFEQAGVSWSVGFAVSQVALVGMGVGFTLGGGAG